MNDKKEVIIIGAGAAGIAAATRLYEQGIREILVLEASDRIGGRIHTVEIGEDGLVDLGAQWVHGEEKNVVFEMASSRDLVGHSDDFRNLNFVTSRSVFIDRKISDILMFIWSEVEKSYPTGEELQVSLGEYYLNRLNNLLNNFEEVNEDLKQSYIEWFHQFINSINGSDNWFDVSVTTDTEYWKCEGDSIVTWKSGGGFANVFSLLLDKAAKLSWHQFEETYIKMNHCVTGINWDNDVTVKCSNGVTYSAKHVIITVSLGVLKNVYNDLFASPLPETHVKAIEGLSISTVDKMFLFFPHRWWPNDVNGFNFLWTKHDKTAYENRNLGWLTEVFGFYKVDSAPLALCGWICGQSARVMESKSENEIQTSLVDLLRDFLGNQCSIPDAKFMLRSCWSSEPYVRGSYSFRSVYTDKLGTCAAELALPIENADGIPVVLFAGEATHEHYYSTVHGAIETGWREADRIISLSRKQNSKY